MNISLGTYVSLIILVGLLPCATRYPFVSVNISGFHWMFLPLFYSMFYHLSLDTQIIQLSIREYFYFSLGAHVSSGILLWMLQVVTWYLDYFSYSSQNMTRFHWVLVFPQKFYMKFYKLWLGTHVSSCILLWMLQVVIWLLSRNMSGFHCVPMFPRLFYWYVASCHCMGLTFLSYFEWKISDFTGYSCFLCYFTRNVTNCSDYSDYSFIHHEILLLFTGWNTRLKKYKVFHNTCTDIINDSILHIISKLQD